MKIFKIISSILYNLFSVFWLLALGYGVYYNLYVTIENGFSSYTVFEKVWFVIQTILMIVTIASFLFANVFLHKPTFFMKKLVFSTMFYQIFLVLNILALILIFFGFYGKLIPYVLSYDLFGYAIGGYVLIIGYKCIFTRLNFCVVTILNIVWLHFNREHKRTVSVNQADQNRKRL